ncbi:MAG: nucleotide exchange factor GrpE [Clostridia bacterium]|nr:nucleotide exchange factor GrpE [Clostridia bacterium]
MSKSKTAKEKKPVEKNTAAETVETAPVDDGAVDAQGAVQETAEMTALQEELKKAQAQSEEYLTMAQRVQADFENYRRRNNAARAEAFEDGARDFIKTVLPVIDNLERALAAESKDPALHEGVSMVYRQLMDVLTKRGVTVIDRPGEKFDPNLENAVMQGTADEGEPGTVCAVLMKGYQLGDHVLRHAMVKVVAE